MKKITAFKCSDGVIEECVDRAIAREIGWHLKKNTAHDANFNTLLAIVQDRVTVTRLLTDAFNMMGGVEKPKK
jgi:hypothetical protein